MTRGAAVAAALLAGLLAGVWLGAAGQRASYRRARREPPDVEKMVKRLERDLSLEAAQTPKVRAALETRRERYIALRKESHERARALRAEIDRDIEAALTEPQKARFARLRAKWEERHAR